jgi:hypothetical protein
MNPALLRVCAIMLIANGLKNIAGTLLQSFYVWGAVIGMIFSPFFVVCAATFFVNPEETRLYAQKLKALFFKWKKLT